MALFSKDGKDFVEISDDAPDLELMSKAGYKPYLNFTKDRQEYVTLPAEVNNVKKMNEAGYKTDQQWQDEEQIQKESKLKFGAGEAFGQGALEQATAGFSDELAAFMAKGSYGKNLEAQRYIQKQAAEQQPFAKGAGEVAGAIGLGALTAGAGTAATTSQAVAKGMLSGGIQNALQSYGESEEKTLAGQAGDVLGGALTGAALGGIGGTLAKAAPIAKGVSEATGGVLTRPGEAIKSAAAGGMEEMKDKAWLGLIPGFGHTLAKGAFLKGAVTDLVDNARSGKQFKQFVGTLRQELGEDAAKLDDATIFNTMLAQEGDNSAKQFFANMVAKERGLDEAKTKQLHDYLVQSPELSKSARNWNLAEKADDVATNMAKVAEDAQREASRHFDETEQLVKQKFPKQGSEVQDEIANTLQFMDKKDLTGSAREAAERAFHELHDDATRIGKLDIRDSAVQSQAEKAWDSYSPAEQYDRYKAAREVLQASLPDPSKVPVNKWDQGQKRNLELVKAINSRLNEAEEKLAANSQYKAWKDIQNLMESKQLFGGDYSATKVRSLLGDSAAGKQLSLNLDKLEKEINLSQLPETQVKPILDVLTQLKEFKQHMGNQAQMAEMVYKLKNLDERTIRRLDQLTGKSSFASRLAQTPSEYGELQAGLDSLAQAQFQKPFNELGQREKLQIMGQQLKGKKK